MRSRASTSYAICFAAMEGSFVLRAVWCVLELSDFDPNDALGIHEEFARAIGEFDHVVRLGRDEQRAGDDARFAVLEANAHIALAIELGQGRAELIGRERHVRGIKGGPCAPGSTPRRGWHPARCSSAWW